MNVIIDKNSTTLSNQLHEQLIILNQSVKGTLPVINTRHIDDILHLPLSPTVLAWNWSKSFNS